jgi:hypothetical protein
MELMYYVIALVVFILAALLFRRIVLWYYKLDKMAEKLENIRYILKAIHDKMDQNDGTLKPKSNDRSEYI